LNGAGTAVKVLGASWFSEAEKMGIRPDTTLAPENP
jgi:hypothetical protein